jgi:hypothetical protein
MIKSFLKINKLVYLFAPLQLISSSFKEAIPLDNINDNISNEIINIEKIESSDIIDTKKTKTTNMFYFILCLILVVLGVIVYLIWNKEQKQEEIKPEEQKQEETFQTKSYVSGDVSNLLVVDVDTTVKQQTEEQKQEKIKPEEKKIFQTESYVSGEVSNLSLVDVNTTVKQQTEEQKQEKIKPEEKKIFQTESYVSGEVSNLSLVDVDTTVKQQAEEQLILKEEKKEENLLIQKNIEATREKIYRIWKDISENKPVYKVPEIIKKLNELIKSEKEDYPPEETNGSIKMIGEEIKNLQDGLQTESGDLIEKIERRYKRRDQTSSIQDQFIFIKGSLEELKVLINKELEKELMRRYPLITGQRNSQILIRSIRTIDKEILYKKQSSINSKKRMIAFIKDTKERIQKEIEESDITAVNIYNLQSTNLN